MLTATAIGKTGDDCSGDLMMSFVKIQDLIGFVCDYILIS